MRLVVNGQQAFGRAVLEALIERGEEVVGVFCAPDREGRPVDPLKEAAAARGLPVFQPSTHRDGVAREAMASLEPDLCVMAYVTQFVPDEVLAVPGHGTIQYHPSLLPRHRGPSSINWPIIAGETTTGLTIFWPDEELDHGPILLQKEVPIGPDTSLGELYFDHLFPMGVLAMLEAVDLIRDGRAPRIEQDHSLATYEGWCRHEDVRIEWNQPIDVVANLARGADPQPGAWTTIDGRVVTLFGVRRCPPTGSAVPGTVTSIDDQGVRIAALDGDLLVSRARVDGGPKLSAAAVGLRVGQVTDL